MSASKRLLYKPAPNTDVGKKDGRKPLIQGRLVNAPVLPDTMTVFASTASNTYQSSSTASNTYQSSSTASNIYQSSSMSRDSTVLTMAHESLLPDGQCTPPRRTMASYSQGSGCTTSPSSNRHSPQRSTPNYVMPQSPPKPSPSRALDLSDVEQEYTSKDPTTATRKHDLSVLMVDASGGRLNPGATEVEIHTGVMQSPAKVICHTPSVVENDLRDTGYVEVAANIPIKAVPSLSIMGEGDNCHPGSDEKKYTDQPVSKAAVNLSSVNKLSMEESYGSVLSDATTEDGSGSLALRNYVSKAEDQGNDSAKITAEKGAKLNSGKERKKKTGKRGRIVSARYMQTASKTTAANASLRQSKSAKPASRVSKQSDKHMKIPVQKPPFGSSLQRKPKTKKVPQLTTFSCTPLMPRSMTGTKHITSTPAMNGSFFPDNLHIDMSALSNVSNLSSIIPDISVLHQGEEDPSVAFNETRDATLLMGRGLKVDLPDKDIGQFDLDKMYARYIQMHFLASKMKKQKQNQEKEAMLQFYLMHQEIEKLNTSKAELEMKLHRLKHANVLDEQLDMQNSGLRPVTAHLKQFQSQYSTLAHALDTTRHQIRTTGIHLPQNEEHFQNELLTLLAESQQLLESISISHQGKTTNTSNLSKALNSLEKAVEAEDKELERGQRLLATASITAAQESSLRIQHIERRTNVEIAQDSTY